MAKRVNRLRYRARFRLKKRALTEDRRRLSYTSKTVVSSTHRLRMEGSWYPVQTKRKDEVIERGVLMSIERSGATELGAIVKPT